MFIKVNYLQMGGQNYSEAVWTGDYFTDDLSLGFNYPNLILPDALKNAQTWIDDNEWIDYRLYISAARKTQLFNADYRH